MPKNTELIVDTRIAQKIRSFISVEKARTGMTYEDISQALLKEFEVYQTAGNIKGKFNRGHFGTHFFLQVLWVLGVRDIKIETFIHDE